MIIPCVSCQSMFRLDNNLIKTTGSKVRCSKCHEIFMVYPPDDYEESGPSNQKSKRDQSVSIPKVEHSLLDDLFQVESIPTEMAISAGKCEKPDNSSNERIEPKEDSEEVAEDENIEYAQQ